jgi:phage shock protein PspC (stress-responsive transcriptional regulator)
MVTMNEADQAFGAGSSGPTPTPPSSPSPPSGVRRLYREPEDKRIAGVCAGLGDYFGVDATVVRLAAILLTFTSGPLAPVAYLAMAAVVPERPPAVPRRVTSPAASATWSTASKVLVVVLAIALIGVTEVGWWFNVPTMAIALVLVGVWILLAERDRPGPLAGGPPPDSTTAGEKTSSIPNAWSAGTTTLTDHPTSEGHDASGLGETTTVDPTGAAGDHRAPSAGPQGEVPPPVPPWGAGSPAYGPPHPAPRRRGAGLPLGVIAALLIGAGIVSLLGVLDVGGLSPIDALAGAVLLIGAAMVLGAWWGNARPLIALGLPAAGLLLLADSVEVPLDAGAGERSRIVDAVGELDEPYRLTAGELTLDLRDLPLGPRTRSAPPTLEAEVALGQLVVIVPRDADVEVDAKVFMGDVAGGPDDDGGGIDVHQRFELEGDEGGGLLVLDLEVGLGEIDVRRA